MAILEIKNLRVDYQTDDALVHALNDVNLKMEKGKTLGLVGETGAGKTTLAKCIMGILPQRTGRIRSGEIFYEDKDLLKTEEYEMRKIRGSEIAMIFQDPMTSLNPVMTVGEQIAEAVENHEHCKREKAMERACEMLELVGIPAARSTEYPHQFSGGMKQRVVIAIALACNPKLLIADEPTTALDVTIQAQILDLMRKLQKKLNTSIMMITHDLGVIAEMADYVLVMYAGRVMEYCDVHFLFKDPLHPYTQGLISALPNINDQKDRLYVIKGNVPSLYDMPAGCGFWPRCPYATERCKTEVPDLYQIGDRKVRCFLHENRKQVV